MYFGRVAAETAFLAPKYASSRGARLEVAHMWIMRSQVSYGGLRMQPRPRDACLFKSIQLAAVSSSTVVLKIRNSFARLRTNLKISVENNIV